MERILTDEESKFSATMNYAQTDFSIEEQVFYQAIAGAPLRDMIPYLQKPQNVVYFKSKGTKVPVSLYLKENLDFIEIISDKYRIKTIATKEIAEVFLSALMQVESEDLNLYLLHIRTKRKKYVLGFKQNYVRDEWYTHLNNLLGHSKNCYGSVGLRKYCDNIITSNTTQNYINSLKENYSKEKLKLKTKKDYLFAHEQDTIKCILYEIINKIEYDSRRYTINSLQNQASDLKVEIFQLKKIKIKFERISRQKTYEISMLSDSLECIKSKVSSTQHYKLTDFKFWKQVLPYLSMSELYQIRIVCKTMKRIVESIFHIQSHWNNLINISLCPRILSWNLFLSLFVKYNDERARQLIAIDKRQSIFKDLHQIPSSSDLNEIYALIIDLIGLFPGIHYCEEMRQISEFLIFVYKRSRDSLYIIIRLAGTPYYLAELWKPGLLRLKITIFQLKRLVKFKLPFLAKHFKKLEVSLYDIVTPWILTVFTCFLKRKSYREIIMRIWDIFVVKGWCAVVSACLAFLYLSQEIVIGESIEHSLQYYKKPIKSPDIYKVMRKFEISQLHLQELESAYYLGNEQGDRKH